jgi:hypothetical protein
MSTPTEFCAVYAVSNVDDNYPFKGTVSRESMSTETIGEKFVHYNVPRICFTLSNRVSKVYDASNRGTLEVKWRGLDFTLLLTPAF